jgi:hypothetical protein
MIDERDEITARLYRIASALEVSIADGPQCPQLTSALRDAAAEIRRLRGRIEGLELRLENLRREGHSC